MNLVREAERARACAEEADDGAARLAALSLPWGAFVPGRNDLRSAG